MKKSVLHILDEATYGGAEITPIRISQNIAKYNHQVLCCYSGEAQKQIEELGIKINILIKKPYSKKKSVFAKYWKFIIYLFNKRYDIIHYHTGGIGILLLTYIFNFKSKIIFHVHSGILTGKNHLENIPLIDKLILRYLRNRVIFIFPAKHVAEYFKKNVGIASNSVIIENSSPFTFCMRELSTNSVGYLGRITEEKGSNSLFIFLDEIKNRKTNFNIFLKGPVKLKDRENIEHYISNSIIFENPSFDIEAFLKKIDLLLFLSTAPEASPLAIFEALSFDVGIIALRSKAINEILGTNYPLLIDNASSDNILAKVQLYYSKEFKIKELSSVHQNISTKYSFQKMIKEVEKLYSKIA